MPSPDSLCLHASCVSFNHRGLLIIGASGRGKSSLALELMALGAVLVSDDRVHLTRSQDQIIAEPPQAIRGVIEARGVGLLNAKIESAVPIEVVVDLDQTETERLPPQRTFSLLGLSLPLFWGVASPHYAVALIQYLKAGRKDVP